jgi:thymidylate synthase
MITCTESGKGFTKGDMYLKSTIERILTEGCLDENPRPKYKDGVPAHTLSVNHEMQTYDLANGESGFTTLRPVSLKSAIGEILWIYQDQSNDLDLLKDKYGITWWDEWDIGNRTIGSCYGETIRRHDLMNNLLEGIKNDPDGRRHIITMWQVDDFKDKHGLKPCCYQTVWNVRHGKDGVTYLDMCMFQRSSDFLVSGTINCLQYTALLYMVAGHFGYTPGRFTWYNANVQIYDRHQEQAKILLEREPIMFDAGKHPHFEVEPKNFYDYTVDDIKIIGYPMKEVKEKNPQLKFDLGI